MITVTDKKDSTKTTNLYSAEEVMLIAKPGDVISTIGNVVDPVSTWIVGCEDNNLICVQGVDGCEPPTTLSELYMTDLENSRGYPEEGMQFCINCYVFENYRDNSYSISNIHFDLLSKAKLYYHFCGGPGKKGQDDLIDEGSLGNLIIGHAVRDYTKYCKDGRRGYFEFDIQDEPNVFKNGTKILIKNSKDDNIERVIVSSDIKDFNKVTSFKIEYNLETKEKLIEYYLPLQNSTIYVFNNKSVVVTECK